MPRAWRVPADGVVLGVITKNMAVFIPPDRPKPLLDFWLGGGSVLALQANVPLLASCPWKNGVSGRRRQGLPPCVSQPDSRAHAF